MLSRISYATKEGIKQGYMHITKDLFLISKVKKRGLKQASNKNINNIVLGYLSENTEKIKLNKKLLEFKYLQGHDKIKINGLDYDIKDLKYLIDVLQAKKMYQNTKTSILYLDNEKGEIGGLSGKKD